MDIESNKKIQARIDELKSSIMQKCANDVQVSDAIDEILSLKGQLDVRPAHFVVDEKDVIDKYEGDTFCIYTTRQGAHFHVKGGYDVFVGANYTSACGMLEQYVVGKDAFANLSGDEKETFDLMQSAITYVLTAPIWIFGNIEDTMELATKIIEILTKRTQVALKESEEKVAEDLGL